MQIGIGSKFNMGFPGGTVVKNSSANTGDERDRGSVPGWRRYPAGGNSIAWRISWIEEPGGLQSMGSQTVRHD